MSVSPKHPQDPTDKDPLNDPSLATRQEVEAALREGSSAVVDVLQAASYREQHIPGALSLPLDQLAERVARKPPRELRDRKKPVIVYCGGYT